MRTFIGWWAMAKTYTDREDIPVSEEPENVDGAVMIRYDNVSKSKIKTSVVEMDKITQVIEVDTRVDIKPEDMIKTEHGWLKCEQVELYLPKDKEVVVRMWANRLSALQVKRVYLV